MIRVGVVGMGKMGLSHLSVINAHPGVEVVGICDNTKYVLDVLGKYTGLATFTDYEKMLDAVTLDAVLIATPSSLHGPMVRAALDRGLHVFCEKPFCLDVAEGAELAALATAKGLVCQVGYHNRFIGAFKEVKRLVDAGAIGRVTHVLAEAYGAVVTKPKGSSWRTQRAQGGGCLYDYAAHPINLVTWLFGAPQAVTGAALVPVFSAETDDQVYGTLRWDGGLTGAGLGRLDRHQRPQDDDAADIVGHRRPALRRPAGDPAVRPRRWPHSRRLHCRVERPLHDRAVGPGRLLPARRGIFGADRRLDRRDRRRQTRERLRQRGRDRPDARPVHHQRRRGRGELPRAAPSPRRNPAWSAS